MNTTYRFKIWYLLLSAAIALAILSALIAAIGALIILILLIVFLYQQGERSALIFPAMFAGLLVVIIPLTLILIAVVLGNALFSYLRIGPTGLELRIWPSYRLRCGWHQIDRLEHVRILGGLLSLPMLRFQEGEIKSWRDYHWHIILDRKGAHSEFIEHPVSTGYHDALLLWAVHNNKLIPVYIFNGWPNGQLRQELESRLGQISFP